MDMASAGADFSLIVDFYDRVAVVADSADLIQRGESDWDHLQTAGYGA